MPPKNIKDKVDKIKPVAKEVVVKIEKMMPKVEKVVKDGKRRVGGMIVK